MKFIDRLKGWVQRMGAETKAAHEYRDVFELGGVPAVSYTHLDVYKRQTVLSK